MRQLEAALLVAQAACCLMLLSAAAPWGRHWPLTVSREEAQGAAIAMSLATCGLQLLVERYRWQLGPAYMSVALTSAAAVVARGSTTATAVAGLLGLVLVLLSAALAALLPIFRLPKPTGPHLVSCATFEMVDEARPEWIAPWQHSPAARRRLCVRLWYPAEAAAAPAGLQRAEYYAGAHIRGAAFAAHHRLPTFSLNHLAHVRSNALVSAPGGQPLPVSGAQRTYPLVIYSHGFNASYDLNTALMEELASHGYVCCAVNHTYCSYATLLRTASDEQELQECEIAMASSSGRRSSGLITHLHNARAPPGCLTDIEQLRTLRTRHLQVRVDDVLFVRRALEALHRGDQPALRGVPPEVADLLSGRLDCAHTGLAGHSFGGATALQAAAQEPQLFKAVFCMDAWTFALPGWLKQQGLATPVVALQAHPFFATPYTVGNTEELRHIIERTAAATAGGRDGLAAAAASPLEDASQPGQRDLSPSASSSARLVLVEGAAHSDFTDVAFWAPFFSTRLLKVTRAGVARMWGLITAESRALFDAQLKRRQPL